MRLKRIIFKLKVFILLIFTGRQFISDLKSINLHVPTAVDNSFTSVYEHIVYRFMLFNKMNVRNEQVDYIKYCSQYCYAVKWYFVLPSIISKILIGSNGAQYFATLEQYVPVIKDLLSKGKLW